MGEGAELLEEVFSCFEVSILAIVPLLSQAPRHPPGPQGSRDWDGPFGRQFLPTLMLSTFPPTWNPKS